MTFSINPTKSGINLSSIVFNLINQDWNQQPSHYSLCFRLPLCLPILLIHPLIYSLPISLKTLEIRPCHHLLEFWVPIGPSQPYDPIIASKYLHHRRHTSSRPYQDTPTVAYVKHHVGVFYFTFLEFQLKYFIQGS